MAKPCGLLGLASAEPAHAPLPLAVSFALQMGGLTIGLLSKSPISSELKYSPDRTFRWSLNMHRSGKYAHVIARRAMFVMFAPAP